MGKGKMNWPLVLGAGAGLFLLAKRGGTPPPPPPPPGTDVSLVSFGWQGFGPNPSIEVATAPTAQATLSNPTAVNQVYWIDVKINGIAIGRGVSELMAPGAQGDVAVTCNLAGVNPGTYSVTLAAYNAEFSPIKTLETGTTLTVILQPPTGLPIETQLASILPDLKSAWVLRGGIYYVYSVIDPAASDLQELFPGESVWLEVFRDTTLTYQGWTKQLVAGWNTVTWLTG